MSNRGSAVVEMSLILPIIFGILVLVLTLFLDTVKDSLVQQEGHTKLYTFEAGDSQMSSGEQETGILQDGEYRYETEGHVFIMETGVCSSRLRRWQLYGDIIWE